MPAPPNSYLLFGYTPEPPKKQPVIKVSCGIGDNDGFPALDSESDTYAAKDESPWGFLITGGTEFHMPLTVFQVTPDGLADKAGIRLGDIILEINEQDATHLSLTQAHAIIEAPSKKIHFLVRSMEDDENMEQGGEDKSIVLRVPKPLPPPKASSIEARLVAMQQKLSEIAEIPRILSSTLATVSRTFDKLMPGELVEHQREASNDKQSTGPNVGNRKFSYDEDAVDYELHDDDESVNGEGVECSADRDVNVEFRFKLPKRKDDTPESDYSSEVEDDDEEAEADAFLRNYDDQMDEDDEDEEEDFLSTTYTWNLRNIPKLQLNGNEPEKTTPTETVSKTVETDSSSDDSKSETDKTITSDERADLTQSKKLDSFSPEPPMDEKHERMEKFERSWPWADREKIIYKQSTCHLVRRKPLGIVEKRIQLLAKQNLMNAGNHLANKEHQ